LHLRKYFEKSDSNALSRFLQKLLKPRPDKEDTEALVSPYKTGAKKMKSDETTVIRLFYVCLFCLLRFTLKPSWWKHMMKVN